MDATEWRHIALLCWLLSLSLVASASERSTEKSVCEIAHNPSVYENVKVIIPAVLVHNGVDVLFLTDSRCSKSGIDIQFVDDAKSVPSLLELMEAIRTSGMYGNPPLEISGRFIGIIRLAPTGAWPESVLVLERTENMVVQPEGNLSPL